MSFETVTFSGQPDREPLYSRPNSSSFKDVLSGNKAFYNQPRYVTSTKQDFTEEAELPVSYTWNTESKVIRIAKLILSIIIFPIGIYNLVHSLIGKIVLPASSPSFLMGLPENYVNKRRAGIPLHGDWKYKRLVIEVDGYKIDALIMGKAGTLSNGRWMLSSNGNGEFYEDKANCHNFKEILSEIKGNAIVFNYPGVGASSGMPNRQAMANAYRAMLNFLEDKERGVGAKEIIGYGHSIGGGVQGDALETHDLKEDVKYVFVKSRTFSDLSSVASILAGKPLGFLAKVFGWNMSSVESSKKLQVPEIIIQTAKVKESEEIKNSSKIIHDGIIPAEASLAKILLEDKECPRENKVFIGIKEGHNYPLKNLKFLAGKIEEFLNP